MGDRQAVPNAYYEVPIPAKRQPDIATPSTSKIRNEGSETVEMGGVSFQMPAEEHHPEPVKTGWSWKKKAAVAFLSIFMLVVIIAVLYALFKGDGISKISEMIGNRDNTNNQNENSGPRVEAYKQQTGGAEQNLVANNLLPVSSNMMIGLRQDYGMQDCGGTALKQTFPDIDYSLYGYNILKGYPLADGRDPGFTRPVFAFDFTSGRHTADCRYALPKGLSAAPDVACRTSFTSRTVDSSHSLESELDTKAHASGGGWGVSFSASVGYKQASSTVRQGKYKLVQSTASCKYYFAKLNTLDLPEFSEEMIEWLNRMNQSIAMNNFIDNGLLYEFVDYFGTHIPIEMVYGARFTYENKITSSKYESMSSSSFSVDVQASYSGTFSLGGGFGLNAAQKQAASNFQENSVTSTISVGSPPPYNGDAMTWASTVKDTPVPVEYELSPIYTLFDDSHPNVMKFLSPDSTRMIKDRIMSVASTYCRRLISQGVDVQCNDDSVIKINKYGMASYGYIGGHDTGTFNIDLDACIAECEKRKDCTMMTLTENGGRSSCVLDDHDENLRSMAACDDCNSYINPMALTGPMGFKQLRYGTQVTRVNKLNIRGSTDLSVINEFCALFCSGDTRCTGFEATSSTVYNWNCATYNEYSEHLVSTESGAFETYVMPDLAKMNFRKEKVQAVKGSFKGADIIPSDKFQEVRSCDLQCCQSNCAENVNCLGWSYQESQCVVVSNERYAEPFALQVDVGKNSNFTFFPERVSQGWLNFTDVTYQSSDQFHVVWSDVYASSDRPESADGCAALCLRDVTCRVADWDVGSNSKCYLGRTSSWQERSPIDVTSSPGSQIMIPNHKVKIAQFQIII